MTLLVRIDTVYIMFYTVNGESFTGLNFRSFRGLSVKCKNFSCESLLQV